MYSTLRKTALALCVASLPLLAAPAQATCRSYTAAKSGATTGYTLSKSAATAWANYTGDYSSAMQNCLSQIRALSLTFDLTSSVDALLTALESKVCTAVVDEINSYIPTSVTLDPWSTVTSTTSSLF